MRKAYCSIILSLFVSGAVAQNVATVNGKAIGNKEFMWFYKKNHFGNANAAMADLTSYLDLYVNFKLKVIDAKEAGLDRDTAYLAEIKNYEAALRNQKRISKGSAEYGYMINEYKEAVLMFNISEAKIWNKSQADESQLRSFYDKNTAKYTQNSYEDAKAQVLADYQQSLEEEWIAVLRKKYPVKVNQDELRKLAKL